MNRSRGTRFSGTKLFLIVMCLMVMCLMVGGWFWLIFQINQATLYVGVMRFGNQALAEFIEAEGRWPRDWDDLQRGLAGRESVTDIRFLREYAKIRFDLDLESIDPQDLYRLRIVVRKSLHMPFGPCPESYLEPLRKAIEAHQRCVRGDPPPADEP